ncbi:MAG: hypothetical protein FVQ77_00240 [Cytophagales bacterium]|nr:hypothetical protein [Cytophagales bacterium]
MNYSKTIDGLSDQAFWDVHFDKLDPKRHNNFIVMKVFDYGNWDDVLSVLGYYGKDRVRKCLINADYLQEHSIDLARWLLDVKPSDFKCFTKKQLHQTS